MGDAGIISYLDRTEKAKSRMPKTVPLVFISSTEGDLGPYRRAAMKAALQANFQPVMMEYFTAQGARPPLQACLEKAQACDVLIAIVAHRYGWVPPDQPDGMCKSITWLECECAANAGKEILAFLIDEKLEWPSEFREVHSLVSAGDGGNLTPEFVLMVNQKISGLKSFKQWLSSLGIRRTFRTTGDVKADAVAALHDWAGRNPAFKIDAGTAQLDPTLYLQFLLEQTAWIDIRGLQVGTGRAHRFPIDELYIPLTTNEPANPRILASIRPKSVRVEEALGAQKVVIVGDPGSGKTTFLRRIAYELCRNECSLVTQLDAELKLPYRGFPILIRIAELESHIRVCSERREPGCPASNQSPAWLSHFLSSKSTELGWRLDSEFFDHKLNDIATVVLLDGLDEAPGRVERECMARLFENATETYRRCRFVVTTRPQSYTERSTLAGFSTIRIGDLDNEAVELFLQHWSNCLYPDNPTRAHLHLKELIAALQGRVEIRRMARNPVMLTALAVVHWNERRLPEQRADLYESIVTWLARSREQRHGCGRADLPFHRGLDARPENAEANSVSLLPACRFRRGSPKRVRSYRRDSSARHRAEKRYKARFRLQARSARHSEIDCEQRRD